ncbi:MAG: very short patch repair endonuclease [Candidatus Thiodiazotropha lotti]|nr:very short patch repair endonuclease [Candidatus Thiodiazotropha lotti]
MPLKSVLYDLTNLSKINQQFDISIQRVLSITMDTVSTSKRSEMMRAVKREGSSAEMRVRRLAHSMGLRYRLHHKDLPGTPDLIFPKHKVCLLVHGCFWHRHTGCKKATVPKSNVDYWQKKFADNIARDLRVQRALEDLGWKVVTIWECQTVQEAELKRILLSVFNG